MALSSNQRVAAIIPARYTSARLPGKPLLMLAGRPMICHVVDRASKAQRIDRVIVATDDQRIVEAVESCGGEAMLTRADHPNGTSRIAEVADTLDDDYQAIVNVQGDEPTIEPEVIDALVDRFGGGQEPMATLASPFSSDEDPADPNIVKVVINRIGQALYFSRALVPYDRDVTSMATPLKHPGMYIYRRDFLQTYIRLPATPLELSEQLEQLRALEHGYPIGVLVRAVAHHGVDTPEQYEALKARMDDQYEPPPDTTSILP